MEAGDVVVRIVAKDENYSAIMTRARRDAQQFGKTIEAAGHSSVSSMQAASGAIRLFEGDITRNIRAVERFITTMPGVGKALQAAFPLVGAAALAGVIYRIGDEAFEAVKKVQELRNKARESFLSLTESALKSTDSLRVTNDKLEEQIALLEHKPVNTMATALDEARERADELAISLNKDYTAFKQVMDANQVSFLGRVLGKGSTKDVGAGEQDRLANIRTLGLQAQQQQIAGDTSGATATGVLIQAAQKEALKWAQNQYAMRTGRQQYQSDGSIAYGKSFNGPSTTYSAAHGDQGQNLDSLQSFQTIVGSQLETAQQQQRNIVDQQKQKQLEAAKQAAEDAKRAMEAAKRAQELLVQQWHKDLDEQKANSDMTLAQEAQFWVRRMEEARKGSLSYVEARDEANKDIARMRGQNMRGMDEFGKTTAESYAPSNMDLSRDTAGLKADGAGAVEYLRNLNQGVELQHANADAIAESSLRMAEMTGHLSHLDVAQAMAALHTEQYAAATKSLADAMEATQSLPDGFEKQQRLAGLHNQGVQMAGGRAIQVMQDQQDISGNTISGAVKDSLSAMVGSFTDMASHLKQVIPETVEGLNDDISKLVTGQGGKRDFARTFQRAGQGAIRTGLQAAEGFGISALTHGTIGPKRDGSSQIAALWVQIATAGMGTAASGMSTSNPAVSAGVGLASLIPGGSFIQPFISSLLPHFANGGDFMANRDMVVGERGPEVVRFGQSGHVVPNHALGSSVSHTYMVDARGSSDPSAVNAAVARALPHAVSASIQGNHAMAKRMPHGR